MNPPAIGRHGTHDLSHFCRFSLYLTLWGHVNRDYYIRHCLITRHVSLAAAMPQLKTCSLLAKKKTWFAGRCVFELSWLLDVNAAFCDLATCDRWSRIIRDFKNNTCINFRLKWDVMLSEQLILWLKMYKITDI